MASSPEHILQYAWYNAIWSITTKSSIKLGIAAIAGRLPVLPGTGRSVRHRLVRLVPVTAAFIVLTLLLTVVMPLAMAVAAEDSIAGEAGCSTLRLRSGRRSRTYCAHGREGSGCGFRQHRASRVLVGAGADVA